MKGIIFAALSVLIEIMINIKETGTLYRRMMLSGDISFSIESVLFKVKLDLETTKMARYTWQNNIYYNR